MKVVDFCVMQRRPFTVFDQILKICVNANEMEDAELTFEVIRNLLRSMARYLLIFLLFTFFKFSLQNSKSKVAPKSALRDLLRPSPTVHLPGVLALLLCRQQKVNHPLSYRPVAVPLI